MKRVVLSILLCLSLLLSFGACGKAEKSLVDFTVDVESGRDIRVLQLTDIQIIQSEQQRSAGRIGEEHARLWSTARAEENYQSHIRKLVEEYKPDLIVMTGDNVYGEFDDSGAALKELIGFMDSLKIPWAPVFGNHDNESEMGVDWQCEQFVNSKYALFKQRELSGNGNYTVGVRQGGVYKRVFFMLDSNGCGNMSDKSYQNGHARNYPGFGEDQIEWYTGLSAKMRKEYKNVKLTACFHIPPFIFSTALQKYGYEVGISYLNENPINLEKVGTDGDFGYAGTESGPLWDQTLEVWNSFHDGGFDSILVGHEHCNSYSVTYEGVRLQFGQKSSAYDHQNFLQNDGTIVGGFYSSELADATPIIGGTAMDLTEKDGSIVNARIILSSGSYR